jgi:hypothetical protein
LGLLARIQLSGANLSVAIPLLSAAVPLLSIAMMVFFFGETTSMTKICLLCAACLLIGVAAGFK